jgi:hypothetical protein
VRGIRAGKQAFFLNIDGERDFQFHAFATGAVVDSRFLNFFSELRARSRVNCVELPWPEAGHNEQ